MMEKEFSILETIMWAEKNQYTPADLRNVAADARRCGMKETASIYKQAAQRMERVK